MDVSTTTTTTPMSSTNMDHGANSPTLMGLPVELRLEIYSYLLTIPEEDDHKSTPSGSSPTSTRPPLKRNSSSYSSSCCSTPKPVELYPQILRACRQTYDEAVEVLYATNKFAAHSSMLTTFPRLHKGSAPVAAAHLSQLIRRFTLRLRLDVAPTFDAAQAAALLSGLDELDVDGWQAQYLGADIGALRMLEGVRGVKRARVWAGGYEAYALWLQNNIPITVMKGIGEPLDEFHEDSDSDSTSSEDM
ncbi:hypothetical protein PG985_001171 [Apiospora marii]|uniref:DUF7730 domain-containing protein n=1 Tax=Apiospora marii TaxID=335849 RepID=A0ABR1RH57_9PEZI